MYIEKMTEKQNNSQINVTDNSYTVASMRWDIKLVSGKTEIAKYYDYSK